MEAVNKESASPISRTTHDSITPSNRINQTRRRVTYKCLSKPMTQN